MSSPYASIEYKILQLEKRLNATLARVRNLEKEREITCGCGLYIHPAKWSPKAIHCSDCPWSVDPTLAAKKEVSLLQDRIDAINFSTALTRSKNPW